MRRLSLPRDSEGPDGPNLDGAVERLSPILMTALAAGLALIPWPSGSQKPGSEIEAPMAVVILFGLLSSTLLSMIVVPVVYLRFGNRKWKEPASVLWCPCR